MNIRESCMGEGREAHAPTFCQGGIVGQYHSSKWGLSLAIKVPCGLDFQGISPPKMFIIEQHALLRYGVVILIEHVLRFQMGGIF